MISVIIPVYNVENYLKECLDSILGQSFQDIEVIVVDDGSTDGSSSICDAYEKAFAPKIKVIHQDNMGLSGARNTGMLSSRGDALFFLDADDYVDKALITNAFNAMNDYDADIVISPLLSFDDSGSFASVGPELVGAPEPIDGLLALHRLHNVDFHYYVCVPGKLYRRSLFSDIRFPLGRIHEDEFVSPYLYAASRRVVDLHVPGYFYRQRANSIVHTEDANSHFDYCDALVDRIAFFGKSGDGEFAIMDLKYLRLRISEIKSLHRWRHLRFRLKSIIYKLRQITRDRLTLPSVKKRIRSYLYYRNAYDVLRSIKIWGHRLVGRR